MTKAAGNTYFSYKKESFDLPRAILSRAWVLQTRDKLAALQAPVETRGSPRALRGARRRGDLLARLVQKYLTR